MKRKKLAKKIAAAIEAGAAYTVYDKKNQPQIIVLPWKNWERINGRLRDYDLKYAPEHNTPMQQYLRQAGADDLTFLYGPATPITTDAIIDEVIRQVPESQLAQEARKADGAIGSMPEDLWGQGDVAPVKRSLVEQWASILELTDEERVEFEAWWAEKHGARSD